MLLCWFFCQMICSVMKWGCCSPLWFFFFCSVVVKLFSPLVRRGTIYGQKKNSQYNCIWFIVFLHPVLTCLYSLVVAQRTSQCHCEECLPPCLSPFPLPAQVSGGADASLMSWHLLCHLCWCWTGCQALPGVGFCCGVHLWATTGWVCSWLFWLHWMVKENATRLHYPSSFLLR